MYRRMQMENLRFIDRCFVSRYCFDLLTGSALYSWCFTIKTQYWVYLRNVFCRFDLVNVNVNYQVFYLFKFQHLSKKESIKMLPIFSRGSMDPAEATAKRITPSECRPTGGSWEYPGLMKNLLKWHGKITPRLFRATVSNVQIPLLIAILTIGDDTKKRRINKVIIFVPLSKS